jgi:hypothetical protein
MVVIVEEEVRQEGGAMVTGLIGSGISPFAGDGLDEAFGLAVGLRTIRFGEEMFDAEIMTGSGKEFGAIGRAAVGEHALDLDAMSFIEGDGLIESVEDAGYFFVGKKTGESEPTMIID